MISYFAIHIGPKIVLAIPMPPGLGDQEYADIELEKYLI
jgi:hypothetical protein